MDLPPNSILVALTAAKLMKDDQNPKRADDNPPSIPAHRFTAENYCGRLGYSSLQAWNYSKNKPQSGFVLVGVCEAKRLQVRARTTGRAIMLYEEPRQETIPFSGGQTRTVGGEEFWIHA